MRVLKRIGAIGVILVRTWCCCAQNEHVALKQWDRVYGGPSSERFSGLIPTADGGLICVGASASTVDTNGFPTGLGGWDFLVVKTDSDGGKQWQALLGGDQDDLPQTIQATVDGGYVVGGTSMSNTNGNKTAPGYGLEDYWIVKLDRAGVKQWEQSFGGGGSDTLGSVLLTVDGGFLLWGQSNSGINGNKTTPGYGGQDSWIIKLDSRGQKQWEQTFGGSEDDYLQSVVQTPDGGFLLGGESYSGADGNKTAPSFGSLDYWVIKVDRNGNREWDKSYGGDYYDQLKFIIPTADAGYLLAGQSASAPGSGTKTAKNFGGFDFWVVKINASGDPQWDATFGTSGDDVLQSAQIASDGSFFLAGNAGLGFNETWVGGNAFWTIKMDGTGKQLWNARISDTSSSFLNQVLPLADGGCVGAGRSTASASGNRLIAGYGGWDYLAARFDRNGVKLWEQSFGGTQDDQLANIITVAGGYVLGGVSSSDVSGNKSAARVPSLEVTPDFWLVKVAEREAPVGAPVVLVNGGFVPAGAVTNGGPAQIQIQSSRTNALLRYTLDGSTPNLDSLAFAGPFTLEQSSTIRAAALGANGVPPIEADPVSVVIEPVYSLRVTIVGDGVATADPPTGPYLAGTTVTLLARPRPGSAFLGWAGDAASKENPLSLVLNSNQIVEARFGRVWMLTVNEGTGGEVTRSAWAEHYADGSIIQLEAHAYDGFVFTGWQGDATGSNPTIQVTVTTNQSVQARFTSTRPAVDVIGRGDVVRLPEKPLYAPGETVTLLATARPNYVFSGWDDGVSDNPRSVVIGTNNHYAAIFTRTADVRDVRLMQWERDYGGTLANVSSRVLVTADGGYLAVGSSSSGLTGNKATAGFGGNDGWVIKLDATGAKEWEQTYGGANEDSLMDAQQTADGGYILAGYSNSPQSGNKSAPNYGGFDYWLVKTDAQGAILWDRSFGGAADDTLRRIQSTADGGFLLAGTSKSWVSGNKTAKYYGSSDFWVIKVDRDGVKEWEQSSGGDGDEELADAITVNDGGYLLCGTLHSAIGGRIETFDHPIGDFWLIKLAADGRPQWDRNFGNQWPNSPKALAQAEDGGYLVTGTTVTDDINFSMPIGDGIIHPPRQPNPTNGPPYLIPWVVKLDGNGNGVWDMSYDIRIGAVQALALEADGGALLGGYWGRAPADYDHLDFRTLRIDRNGNGQWNRNYGGDSRDVLSDLRLTSDGGQILFGGTTSSTTAGKSSVLYGSPDYWLVKVFEDEFPTDWPLVLVNGEYHPDNVHRVQNSGRVEVQSTPDSATLYYTLDGSTPTLTSPRYNQPILVTSNVVVRVLASNPSTRQNVLSDPVEVVVVSPPLQLVSVAALAGNSLICLSFDQPLGPSATNAANYTIEGGASVTHVGPNPDGKSVLLQYSGTLRSNLAVVVQGVTDLTGGAIAGATAINGPVLNLTATNIGAGTLAGSTLARRLDDIEVTTTASSAGGSSDSVHFTFGERTGDFDLAVRVENCPTGATAGLMARESLLPGSRQLSIFISTSPDGVLLYSTERPVDGANSSLLAQQQESGPFAPIWLRLQRTAGAFTMFYSRDGRQWFELAQTTTAPPFADTLFAGLSTFVSAGGAAPVTVSYGGIQDLPPPTPKTDNDRWSDQFGYMEIDPSVFALGLAPDGQLYIGGQFVNGDAKNITAWRGGVWSLLGVRGTNGTGLVRAITFQGTDLYVGGEFGGVSSPTLGEFTVNGIARWDGSDWHRVGTDQNFGVQGWVYALAVHGESVYVGGRFPSAGGLPAANIARWDGHSWSALGTGLGNPANDIVSALTVADDGSLYAGGTFTNSGSGVINRIARWNGQNWEALQSGMDQPVNALAFLSGDLYAGGQFSSAGNVVAKHLAKWNGVAWTEVGGGMTGGDVNALAVEGSRLYVGGTFTEAHGLALFGIGVWDGANWSPLGQGLSQFGVASPEGVYALQVQDGIVYAGGTFAYAGDVYSPGAAVWDGEAWRSLNRGLASSSLSPYPTTVAVGGTNVYVAGPFSVASEVTHGIAQWNAAGWTGLGTGQSNGVRSGNIYSLAVDSGGGLVVGGDFTVAGGAQAIGLARWDGQNLTPFGGGIGGDGLPSVRSLVVDDTGQLFAAGNFTAVGGVPVHNIARWDGQQWHALGDGLNSIVLAMAVRDNELFVGGGFDQAGGQSVNGIARWDGTNWFPLGTGVSWPGYRADVRTIALHGSDIFIGGDFTLAGGTPAAHVARWDGTAWHALDSGVDAAVFALLNLGDDLYLGGDFSKAGGIPIRGLARWDGNSWKSLAGGLDGDSTRVTGLASNGSELFVTGQFLRAGGKSSPTFASWSLNNQPPVVSITQPSSGAEYGFHSAVVLQASASDPDGTVQKVRFYANGQPIGSAFSPPFGLSWTNRVAGVFQITAQAFDNLGASATSAPITLRVFPPAGDQPPTVSLTAPGAGASLMAGSSLAIQADAQDSDGTIARVDFFQNGLPIGTAPAPPYFVTWTNLPIGNFALTAVAIDDLGAATESPPVNVAVKRPNSPPFVNVSGPVDGAVFTIPAVIDVTVTSSDLDGRIVRVELWANSFNIGTWSGGGSQTVHWFGMTPNVYALTARATDDSGATASATVSIVVNGPGNGELAQVLPSNSPRPDLWVPNGFVRALMEKDGTLYVGGDFDRVGPYAQPGALIDLAAKPLDVAFPGANGPIYALASDGQGGAYLGGVFSVVGGVPRSNIAHMLPDKTIDPDWNPIVEANVGQIVVYGNAVYFAGDFRRVNGQPRYRLAAVDAASGQLLNWVPTVSDTVSIQGAVNGMIFLAGYLDPANVQPSPTIGAFDPLTGNRLPWPVQLKGHISALAVGNGQIYLAGGFGPTPDQEWSGIISVDLTTGLPTSFRAVGSGGVGRGAVTSLAVDGPRLYAAGSFRWTTDHQSDNLVAFDSATGELLPWYPNPDGAVNSLVVLSNTVYVAGQFTNVNNQVSCHVAAIDGDSALPIAPNLNTSGHVFAFAISGGRLLAAGTGDLIQMSRPHLAALDTITGAAITWNPGCNGSVYALAASGQTIYVGGGFNQVGNAVRNGLAAVDVPTGTVLPWNPNIGGGVRALAVSGQTLYVGGGIQSVADQPVSYVAAIDIATGALKDWNPKPDGMVESFYITSNLVYIGGSFTTVGGKSRHSLAALDSVTGLATDWDPNPNRSVLTLLGKGGLLYVGGAFDRIGGRARANLAALDMDTGLATLWAPDPSGGIQGLATEYDSLFAVGQFNVAGGRPLTNTAGLDTRIQSNNAIPWSPTVNETPSGSVLYSVASTSHTLYVGGNSYFGAEQRPYLAGFHFAPQLHAVQSSSAGPFQVVLDGAQQRGYVLETSTNLLLWTVVKTNLGPFTFDQGLATNSRSFYRAKVLD